VDDEHDNNDDGFENTLPPRGRCVGGHIAYNDGVGHSKRRR